MAIGGYTTAIMSRDHHTNLVVTMLLAFAICFVVGLLFGLPALRLSGVYLALATFALAVSIPATAAEVVDVPRREPRGAGLVETSHLFGWSLPGVAVLSNRWIYGVAWAFARRSSSLLAWLILRGRVGRAFRAVRDSEIAAVASGVEIGRLQDARLRDLGRLLRSRRVALRPGGRTASRSPSEFGVILSLAAPDRRRRRRSRLALGDPRGRCVRRAPAERLDERPASSARTRPDVVYGVAVILVMLVLPGGFAGLLARLRPLGRA